MIPEAAYAMLACARIGAIHSVVFGGFSPDALAGRIQDCTSTCVITSDEGVRAAATHPAESQHRQGAGKLSGCGYGRGGQAHRRHDRLEGRVGTSGTTRPAADVSADCPAEDR